MSLLLAVDDATGEVPWALFNPEEDSGGYFSLLRGIIERYGIPLAIFTDRHSVFQQVSRRRNGNDSSLNGRRDPTQFGRAMRELGVGQVLAWSPEGKGRVERVAGTFQDRLVGELRLAGTTTLTEANQVLWRYLPRYNERFAVPATRQGSAYRELPPDLDLDGVLCFKHQRKVAKDNTVKYSWRTLQLLPSSARRSHAGLAVEVQERLDGTLAVVHQGEEIAAREIPHSRTVTTGGQDAPADWQGLTEQLARFLPTSHEIAMTPSTSDGRKPTPRMIAYWEAIHEARGRGLAIKAISRELGIARKTVRKYLYASDPPIYRRRSKTPENKED